MRRRMFTIGGLTGMAFILFCLLLQMGQNGRTAAAPQLTPTLGPTPTPYYNISVEVNPSASEITLGEQITVTVNLVNHSTECVFAGYDMALSELGTDAPHFQFDSPATVGPPLSDSTVFTLTAVANGIVQFRALAYGERYCNDFWLWRYESGTSLPVIVGGTFDKQFLPVVFAQ